MIRHSLAHAALFVLVVCGLASAQVQPATENQPGQEEGAPDTPRRSPDQQPNSLDVQTALQSIETAIRDLKSEVDEVEEKRAQEQATRELSAQEAMAWWAELMFYTAFATVLLTAAALAAIIRTLHHTSRAANSAEKMVGEAKRTTEAALKTVAVTEEIGSQQLRPFIVYDSGKIRVLGAQRSRDRLLEIDVSFRNGGASPGIMTAASSAIYAPGGKAGWSLQQGSKRPFRVVFGPNQIEKVRFGDVAANDDGTFSSFAIGILIWYESLSSRIPNKPFEEHFWLYFDGTDLRQDFHDMGFALYRPKVEEK